MIRVWLAIALGILVAFGFFTSAYSEEPRCRPSAGILAGLKAMGRDVQDVTDSAEVRRGVDFLNTLTDTPVSPEPDRILFIGNNGATAVSFGHGGLICPPIVLSADLARDFHNAIFGGPKGEDI